MRLVIITKSIIIKIINALLANVSDEICLAVKYRLQMKEKLNLNTPIKFNEKLQWLKIHDRKYIYTTMVDKFEVKGYISEIIGKEYELPTIGIYEKFKDINFDELPNQFVMKCTHDSGGLIICKDKNKLNIKEAKRKINKSLKRNYYYATREWPYKNVKPRIIIEQYMEDDSSGELKDYKFWCFNGEPKICLVCTDRQTNLKETFFDMEWNLLNIKRPGHNTDITIRKPENFELMKKLSKKLSNNIPFIRVDLYEINGKVYFGELTFFPAAGFVKFEPEEWDYKLGNMLELESNKVYLYELDYNIAGLEMATY